MAELGRELGAVYENFAFSAAISNNPAIAGTIVPVFSSNLNESNFPVQH